MAYDEKHMDTARRLARHAAEREWLRAAYETLERQTRVLDALYSATQHMYPDDDGVGKLADKLLAKACRVVIAQCESIMRHSGIDADALAEIADPPSGDQAVAREETLPW